MQRVSVFDIPVWGLTAEALSLLIGACSTHAEPITPRNDSSVRVNTITSRLQCSPVTPDTKVPWIEVSQLPDLTRDSAYFEACSDLDHAWTTQSYPNPKYVPDRTPEHEARVSLFLQGIKDYVSAESDDWVAYVNAWLGAALPPSKVEYKVFSDGETTRSISFVKGQALLKLGTSIEILGVYGRLYVSSRGANISSKRDMSIVGIDTEKLCVTPVDLQKAFENQPGYLFRPASVRSTPYRPTSQDLTKLGGQWFGYQVHVFSGPHTGKYAGLMRIEYGFKPCAASIQIELSESRS